MNSSVLGYCPTIFHFAIKKRQKARKQQEMMLVSVLKKRYEEEYSKITFARYGWLDQVSVILLRVAFRKLVSPLPLYSLTLY